MPRFSRALFARALFARALFARALFARALLAAFAGFLFAAPAAARITDPELSCADWLKASAHRKSERSTVAERIRAFCAANPKMKAIDAETTMTGD